MRQLKRQLRALAATSDTSPDDATPDWWAGQPGVRADEALTQRLLAMAGPGGPVPSRWSGRGRFRRGRRGRGSGQPPAGRPPHQPRRRGRYVLWSAVSLVVVGIGAAAFTMGGGTSAPGPSVTPQVEMYSLEHAITSGDVPYPDPTQAPTANP